MEDPVSVHSNTQAVAQHKSWKMVCAKIVPNSLEGNKEVRSAGLINANQIRSFLKMEHASIVILVRLLIQQRESV